VATIPNQWPVALAKARLSELLEQVDRNGPQTILKNGKRRVVVVSAEEWDRRTGVGKTLSQFLMDSPLGGSGIEFPRHPERARRIKL
jgi:prevent-host-death family protein